MSEHPLGPWRYATKLLRALLADFFDGVALLGTVSVLLADVALQGAAGFLVAPSPRLLLVPGIYAAALLSRRSYKEYAQLEKRLIAAEDASDRPLDLHYTLEELGEKTDKQLYLQCTNRSAQMWEEARVRLVGLDLHKPDGTWHPAMSTAEELWWDKSRACVTVPSRGTRKVFLVVVSATGGWDFGGRPNAWIAGHPGVDGKRVAPGRYRATLEFSAHQRTAYTVVALFDLLAAPTNPDAPSQATAPSEDGRWLEAAADATSSHAISASDSWPQGSAKPTQVLSPALRNPPTG